MLSEQRIHPDDAARAKRMTSLSYRGSERPSPHVRVGVAVRVATTHNGSSLNAPSKEEAISGRTTTRAVPLSIS